jgi:hypothetical protein
MASTLIAIFGFGGYSWPRYKVEPCRFCRLSTGGHIPFYEHKAPIALTESGSTDSTIGCTRALLPVLAPAHAYVLWLPAEYGRNALE